MFAASTISINFVGNATAMVSTDTAGAVASASWNNAVGAARSTPLPLVDATGAATTATASWTSDNTWQTPITDIGGSTRMMKGYLDTGSLHPTTVNVTGIPAGTYDIYLYADGDNGTATRSATYQISGSGITTAAIGLTDLANTNFNGTFVQANGSAGNYVRFASVTATGFTITATPGSSSDAYPRAPVNGIQIVPSAPPPSTPDFAIGVTPSSQTVTAGGSTSYTVTVGALNGFANTVSLSASGLPSGASASFSPASIAGSGSATMTVTTSASTPAATTTFTVTGTSGSLTHGTSASLTVGAPPNFTMSISPSSRSVAPGVSTTYAVTVGATGGFAGTVSLGINGLPSGATASFNPSAVATAGTSTLTVTTSSTTPFGTSTLTITGTGGSLSHSVTAGLSVTSTTYTLSGSMTPTSSARNATVTVTGPVTATATVNWFGNYSVGTLPAGTYVVTPSKAGYTFTPASRTVTITNASVTGVNFTAATVTYSISGTISPTTGGAGATVTLSGAASKTTTTDASGAYSVVGLANGTYTVTPSNSGYTFSPASASVALNGANVTGVNFAVVQPTVIFFDDFTGSSLDTTWWTAMNRQGDLSNNEVECYQPANVTTGTNSNLAITTQVQPIACGGTNFNYTSGMVQWTTFNFLYGTVEIRAKLTGGTGPWPALWLLGYNCQAQNINFDPNGPCNWPQPGSDEVDIVDDLYSSRTNVYEWIHSGTTNAGCIATTTDMSQNWHTYSLVWSPGKLVWKIDGVTSCTMQSGVPSTPMFLILNVAVGGNGGGTVAPSTFPQTMLIDYVKVSQP